jgi:hypothetical protein
MAPLGIILALASLIVAIGLVSRRPDPHHEFALRMLETLSGNAPDIDTHIRSQAAD